MTIHCCCYFRQSEAEGWGQGKNVENEISARIVTLGARSQGGTVRFLVQDEYFRV